MAGVESGWKRIHLLRVDELSPEHRELFNHFSYNMDLEGVYAFPIEERFALNPQNYTNHSCDPNLWYAENSDALIARHDIRAETR